MGSKTTPELNELNERTGRVPQHAKQETRDLPKWAKLALARVVMYDEKYREAAEHFKRTESSLQKLASSPAGKKWRAKLEELAEDPVFIAEALIRSNAVGVTFDAFWAMETAKGARDYKEVGLIARDLMDRIPELRRQQGTTPTRDTQIVIQLGGGTSLEPLTVEASHTKQIESGPVIDAELIE